MRIVFRLLVGCAVFAPVCLSAQTSVLSAEADRDWGALTALQNNVVAQKPPLKSDPAANAANQARTDAFRQLAQSAKDFYTQHPADANAPLAKKLEALAGIEGSMGDNQAQEQAALKVASDYRGDLSNPVTDRFEVACAAESHVVSEKLGGASWLSSPIESENMADRLHAEFGELPHVHGTMLAVAEATTCDNAADSARKLLQTPAVSPAVRLAAQRILDRAQLLGQKLDFPLTTSDGKTVRLRQLEGAHTVVYVWDAGSDAKGPPGLQAVKSRVPSGTQWVYVALGAFTPTAAAAKARGVPAGTYCVEAAGIQGAVADQLKVSRLPCAYVFDANGILTGFGQARELPVLLTRAYDPNRLP